MVHSQSSSAVVEFRIAIGVFQTLRRRTPRGQRLHHHCVSSSPLSSSPCAALLRGSIAWSLGLAACTAARCCCCCCSCSGAPREGHPPRRPHAYTPSALRTRTTHTKQGSLGRFSTCPAARWWPFCRRAAALPRRCRRRRRRPQHEGAPLEHARGGRERRWARSLSSPLRHAHLATRLVVASLAAGVGELVLAAAPPRASPHRR